jgi:phosphoglycolate phosphatase-like HAD superfamily hydrolase
VTGHTKADIIVFDVDGVLVDASRSYPRVIARSLLWAWIRVLGRIPDCEGFTYEHFAASKTHPAFNDDYDIAWAFINCTAASSSPSLADSLPSPPEWREKIEGCRDGDIEGWVRRSFGERVPRAAVRKVCEEMYFGCDEYEALGETPLYTTRRGGLWEEETSLVSFHWSDLPVVSAIYTGRPRSELFLALKLIGWTDFPGDLTITPDDGITKPSPLGLSVLCEKTGASFPLFLGDAESDRKTVSAFGRGTFAAIGDFLPDEAKRYKTPEEALRDKGLLG